MITGSITATSGQIGGFTIDGNAITYNGLTWKGGGSGVYLGPSGLQLGPNFRVDSNGNLTANSGVFSGSVYAGNIVYGSDYGYLHGDGIQSQTISGGRIASRTITGGNVASGTISTTNTSSGINTSLGYADFANGVFNGWNSVGNLFTGKLKVTGSCEIYGSSVGMYSATLATPSGGSKTIYYWGYA